MTRPEKVRKLANAIRDYRGATSSAAGAAEVMWARPPKRTALARVQRWLQELRLAVGETTWKIDGFRTYAEFETWIKSV